MGVLYTLVPEGRWRNTGKCGGYADHAGGPGPDGVGHRRPHRRAGRGRHRGLDPAATVSPLHLNEAYLVTYRRGRAAHLDVGGARGAAIRRALSDQLGLVVTEVKPFGLAGSAGSTPLRITVAGDPLRQLFGKLYAQSHLRSDRWYKLGREYAVRAAGGRKAVQQRAAAGPAGGLRLSLMALAGCPARPFACG